MQLASNGQGSGGSSLAGRGEAGALVASVAVVQGWLSGLASRTGAASADSAGEKFRYGYIDTLRGVACLLVVYLHSVLWLRNTSYPINPRLEALLQWSTVTIDPGKIGVLIFFIISGYVVPFSLLRNHRRPVLVFMIGRFFRLYPVYWLSIGIGAIVVHYYLDIASSERKLLANLTMAQTFFGEPHVLRIYWSLEVELIFYGLCVVMYLVGGMRYVWAPGLVALALLSAAFPAAMVRHVFEVPLPVGLPLALSLLFFGFAVRQSIAHGSGALRRHVNGLLGLYFLSLPAICYLAYSKVVPFYGTWTSYLWSYYLALTVFCGVVLVRPVSWRTSEWIGRISYSVYLFHLICLHVIGYYLVELLPADTPGVPLLILFPLAALVISHPLFVCIEQPGIRLGRALARRLS
jgi:peptidoglycan/LPS O-acetylase OafA/YrhL